MLRRNSSYFSLCPFYLVFSFEKNLTLPFVLPPIRLLFTLIRSPQRLLKAKQSHLCQALFLLKCLQCPVMQYMKLPPLNYVFSMFASWSVYTEFLRPQSHRQVNQPDLTLATFWPVFGVLSRRMGKVSHQYGGVAQPKPRSKKHSQILQFNRTLPNQSDLTHAV